MRQLKVLFFALLALVGVACSKSDEPKQASNYLDGKTFINTTRHSADENVYEEITITFGDKELDVVVEFRENDDHMVSRLKATYTYVNGRVIIGDIISAQSKNMITGAVTVGAELDDEDKVLVVDEVKGTLTEVNRDNPRVFTLKK